MLGLNKIKGFTLAEVLIVLGIIGIIAALTIPAILNQTQKREIVVAFKTGYSDLSNAINQIKTDNGGEIIGGIGSNSGGFITILQNYIKFSKICHNNSYTEGCTDYTGLNANNIKMLNGDNFWWPAAFTGAGAITSNGMVIVPTGHSANCTNPGLDIGFCDYLSIDVNGSKPPNIFGRDILRLYVTTIGLVPAGTHGDRATTDPANFGCKEAGGLPDGEGCAARILREDAINY